MRNVNDRGYTWLFIMSIMILAMPLLILANDSATGIEQIKQLRHVQNQSTILKNLEANSTALKATPEQERMLGLSKALTRLKHQPALGTDPRLNLKRTERAVPQLQSSASRELREVMYGSGRMSSHPDSIYFNFLTGMNGSDTTGMDVKLSGNEGTNFGNDSWLGPNSFVDPSMLFFLAVDGSLEDMPPVPSSDAPDAVWTHISWDWQGGNGGQPIAVGNLWAVHTRTSNMYAVLEITHVGGGWDNPNFSFDYVIQTDGSPFFDDEPGSIIYNSGEMHKRPDSLYFNYYTGMMGNDTLDMDVMISSNEGTNFGSEGAWIDGVNYPFFTDPSLIYYYSPMGNLDTVSVVPSVDDPNAVWTTISWDWQGGNNGQPLAPGNLWVIYTRTTNMYVVMQVTDVSAGWTDNWFTFDYMIQTNGSNVFDGGMVEPMYDITVDGMHDIDLPIGSNPYVEINLDMHPGGEFGVFWDANRDGELDEGDVPMEFYPFMDNDMHDEDPAPGIFGFTYNDEMADGLNYLADDLIFAAFSGMDVATSAVTFTVAPSPFSVSGSVYAMNGGGPPLADIVVWAIYEGDDDEQPAVIVLTDGAGQYTLNLPDTGNVMVGTEDHFMVTGGYMPDPSHHFVNVQGNEFGFNFYYIEPTSGIEGFIYDELGNPLQGVEVKAGGDDGPSAYGSTNESGYYYLSVMPGYYDVGIDHESLPSPYVVPRTEWVDVDDDEVATVNFTLYSANNFIVGVVTLDGAYYEGATIVAMNELGFSYTMSTTNGYFDIPVHGGPETFYDLMVWMPDMQDIIQVSDNHHVPAGAEGVGIVLETVTGGIFGYFIDAETMQPIMDSHDIGMMMRDIDTGMEYYGGPDYYGYYELRVPPGVYEVMAGGHEWMGPEPDTLAIADMLIPHDFYLTHMSFDASLDGFVYDDTGMPIPFAQVQIGNQSWGSGTMADEFGHYHFDLPVGYYYVSAWAPGFSSFYDELPISPGPNNYNFFLSPFMTDGAIGGIVSDFDTGAPISGANVYAYSWDAEGFWTSTDDMGHYWFDLPNGTYDISVEHWDYPPMWEEGVPVQNDTTYLDFALQLPDGGVEGHVMDDMGHGIYDAEVVIISLADSTTGFWGYTDESGYFSIPALNGDYAVFAGAPGFEETFYGPVTVADNWVDIDIYLEPREFASAPEINFIIDQPNDQGRWVRMQFMPGGTDWGPYHAYSIWRMTNTPMGPIMDFVEYLPHHDFDMYNVVLPTLVDSSMYVSDPEDYMSMFMVTGHYDMFGYVDGDPGIGYSVDNIHPGVPSPLVLLSADENHVEMQWEASMDDDFQYFEVHRATNPSFTDGAVVEMTTAPGFSDMDVTVGQTYYYQVVALDANGNASAASNMISTTIVSVDEAELLPTAFGLSQNYPNPFNPTTSIQFALPQASDVNLVIYNILGQKVRTLVNGYMPAGYITTSWDGLDQNGKEISSGTYIYRLETGEMSFSKKMVLMK